MSLLQGEFGAESLITNADTGARNIQGQITKAAAVRSRETVSEDAALEAQRGKPIYFVSIKVGGAIVTLAHTDVGNTGKPNAAGLWAAVDEFSETATKFPYNPSTPMSQALRANLQTDGARESRACVS